MSGNEFLDNLDVKNHTNINNIHTNLLKVKNNAMINNIISKSIKTRSVSLSDKEISFNKDSIFKLGNTKMV